MVSIVNEIGASIVEVVPAMIFHVEIEAAIRLASSGLSPYNTSSSKPLIMRPNHLTCLLHVFICFPVWAFVSLSRFSLIGTNHGHRTRMDMRRSLKERPRGVMSANCPEPRDDAFDRATFFSRSGAAVLGAAIASEAFVWQPQRALAAAETAEEPSEVKWDEEFATARKDSSELLREIRKLAAAEDWTNVMETTRMSDFSFRKKVMGNIRKKLPKALKDEALSLSNDVSFDLIAVNKAARVGSKERAMEVCDILEKDIESFLRLESRI